MTRIQPTARAGIALLWISAFLYILGNNSQLAAHKGPATRVASATKPMPIDKTERLAGGSTTFVGPGSTGKNAFRQSLDNLHLSRKMAFQAGRSLFREHWVTAPASTKGIDGLGPLFNTRSCSSCHFRDGRSKAPLPGKTLFRTIVKLSIPGTGAHGAPLAEPKYGGQLSPRGILHVKPEGIVTTQYKSIRGKYADGTPYKLRKPTFQFGSLRYGALHPKVMYSVRVAPAIIGLGLLEAIPQQEILRAADPKDRDQDGISGKPNLVWSLTLKRTILGRFGWKASQPDLGQQIAGALQGDMGITNPLLQQENCTKSQVKCRKARAGGAPEINKQDFGDLLLYTRTLAVPERKEWKTPQVQLGKALFHKAACQKCHTPTWKTGRHPQIPALSNQKIWPYTDLLLHDMGPGLADNRPEFKATGSEWRTPPLWGIGKIKTVNGHTNFLHDGRARNLAEAILWHDGEGKAAKRAFLRMTKAERAALLQFLRSL